MCCTLDYFIRINHSIETDYPGNGGINCPLQGVPGYGDWYYLAFCQVCQGISGVVKDTCYIGQ